MFPVRARHRAGSHAGTNGSCRACGTAWSVLSEQHNCAGKTSPPAAAQRHSQSVLAAAQAGARYLLPSWLASDSTTVMAQPLPSPNVPTYEQLRARPRSLAIVGPGSAAGQSSPLPAVLACAGAHTHAHTPAHVLCLTRAGACCALGPAASRRAAPQQSERNSASLGSPQVEVLGLNQLGEGEMLLCIGCLLRHQSDPAGSVTCHSSSKGSEQPFHQGDEGKHSSSKAQHHPGRFAGPHPAHPGFL